MGFAILLLVFLIIFCAAIIIEYSDDGFIASCCIAGICFGCFMLGGLFVEYRISKSQTRDNTEIIHRYEQGNYSLEVRIDEDKIDTLYIFK